MKFLGFFLAGLLVLHWFLSPKKLPESFLKKPMTVIGSINSIPEKNKLGLRFLLKSKVGNIQVSWYRPIRIPHTGEHWQFLLKLRLIHGLHNPNGFNLERWAKMHDIVASAYVLHNKALLLSKASISINAFREKVQDAIQHHVHSQQLGSIINALSIGSKKLISADDLLVFQKTGTAHLIAISGLHISLVVLIAYYFCNGLVRCIPWLLLQWPAQRIANLFSMLVAWIYSFLVGFSLPTERAIIMVTVWVLSTIFFQPLSVVWRLLLAFVVIFALQPLALFSSSFWLSFMAVFWIAYARGGKLSSWRVKWVLNLGLLPITLYCFHQVALMSIFANLVAIPWVTLLIVPLCLSATIIFLFSKGLACWIWSLAAQCFSPLWYLFLSLWSLGQWLHPINDFWVLLSALIGTLWLAAPYGLPLRSVGVVLLIPIFFVVPARPKNKVVWLTVLDVGQGLATVIQTAHHVLIYDTGPRFPMGLDAGRSVVIPFLQTHGIEKITMLIVSHGDNDHIGGSFWLVKHIVVKSILSSIPKSPWHRAYNHCYAGQHWQWDGVQFHMLWPPKEMPYQDNNSSCVLRISIGKQAILLTGDIEKEAERALLLQKVPLASTVLVVPHHGSRSSSSLAFIRSVHPIKAIISTGYKNHYHFPAPSVLERYRDEGAEIFSTAQYGAVQIVLGIG